MTSEEILIEFYWLSINDKSGLFKNLLNFMRCGSEEADGLLEILEEQNFSCTDELCAYFDAKKTY